MAIAIISGGPGSGAVLSFGLDRGYRICGFVPRGRLEDAPERFRPHLTEIAGDATHCAVMRVTAADAVLVIGRQGRETERPERLCAEARKPILVTDPADPETPEVVRTWLARRPAWQKICVVPAAPPSRPPPDLKPLLARALWPKSVSIAVTVVTLERGHFALAKFCYVAPDATPHTRALNDAFATGAADAAAEITARALAELRTPSAVWVISDLLTKPIASARHRVAVSRPFDAAGAELLESARVLATALAATRSSPPPSPGAATPNRLLP